MHKLALWSTVAGIAVLACLLVCLCCKMLSFRKTLKIQPMRILGEQFLDHYFPQRFAEHPQKSETFRAHFHQAPTEVPLASAPARSPLWRRVLGFSTSSEETPTPLEDFNKSYADVVKHRRLDRLPPLYDPHSRPDNRRNSLESVMSHYERQEIQQKAVSNSANNSPLHASIQATGTRPKQPTYANTQTAPRPAPRPSQQPDGSNDPPSAPPPSLQSGKAPSGHFLANY